MVQAPPTCEWKSGRCHDGHPEPTGGPDRGGVLGTHQRPTHTSSESHPPPAFSRHIGRQTHSFPPSIGGCVSVSCRQHDLEIGCHNPNRGVTAVLSQVSVFPPERHRSAFEMLLSVSCEYRLVPRAPGVLKSAAALPCGLFVLKASRLW